MTWTCWDFCCNFHSKPSASCGRPQCVLPGRSDGRTLRWLTNDGVGRLTQSRRETSSSSTDDDLDGSDFVEKGAR